MFCFQTVFPILHKSDTFSLSFLTKTLHTKFLHIFELSSIRFLFLRLLSFQNLHWHLMHFQDNKILRHLAFTKMFLVIILHLFQTKSSTNADVTFFHLVRRPSVHFTYNIEFVVTFFPQTQLGYYWLVARLLNRSPSMLFSIVDFQIFGFQFANFLRMPSMESLIRTKSSAK